MSLFYFFGGDGTHLPHPRRSLYTPPVETPAPAHPDSLHSTGSKADHAKNQSGQVLGQTDAQTLDCLRSASETEQKRTAQNLKNKYAKKRKYLLTFTQESV